MVKQFGVPNHLPHSDAGRKWFWLVASGSRHVPWCCQVLQPATSSTVCAHVCVCVCVLGGGGSFLSCCHSNGMSPGVGPVSWDLGTPLLPHQRLSQTPSSHRGPVICSSQVGQRMGQWPLFWSGTSSILLESLMTSGKGGVSRAVLARYCWAPQSGKQGGCRRKEGARKRKRRKAKEFQGSQEIAGLARFPEGRPGQALEWRRPEGHEEWGLCQLPPLSSQRTDAQTDRQTDRKCRERWQRNVWKKSREREGRGRSLCAPWADSRPLLSLHFQEGRCCCLSQALAEGLARDRGALPSSIACS
ncbi:uncharacterized protein LOC116582109 [Mustela erminea]|uniref:uncharacterized protein LOC116582109 n=1 Tax=Mustela erminea TaxID=36723 RepID=UPI001386DC0E|nr:uncharacterized protein LOC116582109 [Mustela erminea]